MEKFVWHLGDPLEIFLVLPLPNFKSKWKNISVMTWEGHDNMVCSYLRAEVWVTPQVNFPIPEEKLAEGKKTLEWVIKGDNEYRYSLTPAAVILSQ